MEKLYLVLYHQLEEWEANNTETIAGIRVLGYPYSPKSYKIEDFLAGNLFPYKWIDVETNPTAPEIMTSNGIKAKDLPAVIFDDNEVFTGENLALIAAKPRLQPNAKEKLYDVAIIGAGPAGLAAGVYGGSDSHFLHA